MNKLFCLFFVLINNKITTISKIFYNQKNYCEDIAYIFSNIFNAVIIKNLNKESFLGY